MAASLSSMVGFHQILPVREGTTRPTWSVMIPTYNCAHYLRETIVSVLQQDPGPELMQIEVVDDCSTTDNPEQVVREVGGGRVAFFRQARNVGATANFNTCIERSYGHVVHILHGDDKVLPAFYASLQKAFTSEPQVGAAFCRYVYMDEAGFWQGLSGIERTTPGLLEDWTKRIFVVQRIQCPAIAVRREVYERIGGFNVELFHATDWDMWKRIAVNNSVWYEPQVLACYRQHSSSDSSKLVRTGANISDIRKSIEISNGYLPADRAQEITHAARKHYAQYGLDTAKRLMASGDRSGTLAQIRESLKCDHSFPTIIRATSTVILLTAQVFRGMWRRAKRLVVSHHR